MLQFKTKKSSIGLQRHNYPKIGNFFQKSEDLKFGHFGENTYFTGKITEKYIIENVISFNLNTKWR